MTRCRTLLLYKTALAIQLVIKPDLRKGWGWTRTLNLRIKSPQLCH